MAGRPSRKPLAQSETVAQIMELRAALGLSVPEMAARLGVKRQSLWAVLYGVAPPGPKIDLGLMRLRTDLKQDAARMRAQADALVALSR